MCEGLVRNSCRLSTIISLWECSAVFNENKSDCAAAAVFLQPLTMLRSLTLHIPSELRSGDGWQCQYDQQCTRFLHKFASAFYGAWQAAPVCLALASDALQAALSVTPSKLLPL